jgi:hypothetical protein
VRGVRLTVAVAVAALALAAPPAARAATDASLAMVSDPGAFVGGGQPRYFTERTADFRIQGDTGEVNVYVDAHDGRRYVHLDLAAPPDENLRRGVYERAQRSPFNDAGRPGLAVGADHHGCNRVSGRFEVKDIGVDSRGRVNRLWVVFEHHCEGGPRAVFGELRIGRPPGSAPATAAPAVARWPSIDPGRDMTPTPVTIEARRALAVRGLGVVGRDRGDFSVASQDCTGRTLRAGGSCRAIVDFRPAGIGTRRAALRITDTKGRRREVALEGFVHGGRTRLQVQSEPGDPVGDGRPWAYTSDDAVIQAGGTKAYASASVHGDNDDYWFLEFGPSEATVLAPGRYPDAGDDVLHDTRHYLNVDRDGTRCDEQAGEFTVSEITFHPDGGLKTFGASFEQRCEGSQPPLRGLFEFRAGDTVERAPWMVSRNPGPVKVAGPCAKHYRGDNVNGLRGTKAADVIGGHTVFSDAILAGAGNDRLYGREQDDCLDGGPGDDRLDGGPGRDVLDCGSGRDSARVTKGDRVRDCERVIR